MGYDPQGSASFWETLKCVGLEVAKQAAVVAGIATAAALIIGGISGTIVSGGAAAVALPAAFTLAVSVAEASIAIATVSAGVAAVGAAGDSIQYSKSAPKGKSFRGGSKKQRDRWYGYNEKSFQKWFERVGKHRYNDGMDIDSKAIADAMYEIWKELGCPFPK